MLVVQVCRSHHQLQPLPPLKAESPVHESYRAKAEFVCVNHQALAVGEIYIVQTFHHEMFSLLHQKQQLYEWVVLVR